MSAKVSWYNIFMSKRKNSYRARRIISLVVTLGLALLAVVANPDFWQEKPASPQNSSQTSQTSSEILQILDGLEVKGRAPKTGYARGEFGRGWAKDSSGCDTRNRILKRDLKNTTENEKCQILTGILNDPYTGQEIIFDRAQNAAAIQIDHVVALSDAWQKGAQQLDLATRTNFANDPLNLLASEGDANQAKGDSDAASWLPPNKAFRCEYVTRQVRVKQKYSLWVTEAEKAAMKNVLTNC